MIKLSFSPLDSFLRQVGVEGGGGCMATVGFGGVVIRLLGQCSKTSYNNQKVYDTQILTATVPLFL